MPKKPKPEKRDEFYAAFVTVLNVGAANEEHGKGQPISILAFGKGLEVEQPLAISLADSRLVVTKLLVVLATHKDQFARDLLDDHFVAGRDGHFAWPAGGDGDDAGL